MMSRRDWLFALALLVVTFLVYAPAWNGQPIWDDETHLTPPQLRSLHGLARIWTEPAAAPQYYPVLHTVFWIEQKLWGDWLLPYHLVTVALHVCTAFLLLKILERLEVPGAWLAAGIFAVHPVMVESVAWMCELKNTLSGVLCAATVLVYLNFDRDRKRGTYVVALALFLIGLMAKTVIGMLPAALLVIFWWKRGRLKWAHDVWPLVPFFLTGIGAGLLTAWIERKYYGAEGRAFDLSTIDRFLIAGRAFWFYLAKLVWPANLITIYPRWHLSAIVWWQYLFSLAAVLLLTALWIVRRRWRGPLAAVLVFGVMVFPMLGFLNIGYFSVSFVADHFQYLASIGIITLCAAGLAILINRVRESYQAIGYGLCILLLATLASLSFAQSRNYRDNETCFRAVLARNPQSATAHNNLANTLRKKGALDEAIVHYRRALVVDPDYEFGRFNLGSALAERGEIPEAIGWLKAALTTDPNNANAYYTLANALARQNNRSDAIAYYGRALRLAPDFPDAHTNLANLLLETGNSAGALEHYREALRLEPNNPQAHYNLAVGLVRAGQNDAAIPELRAALQLDPKYPDAEPLLNDLLSRSRR